MKSKLHTRSKPHRNLQIHDYVPAWLDAINRQIGIIQLIEFYGVGAEHTKEKKGNIHVGRCPLHGGHADDEFYIYGNHNMWACYGACHRGGTVLDFVSVKEGVPLPVAAMLLQTWFSQDLVTLGLVDGRTLENIVDQKKIEDK